MSYCFEASTIRLQRNGNHRRKDMSEVRVAAIQPAIVQTEKWEDATARDIFARLAGQTRPKNWPDQNDHYWSFLCQNDTKMPKTKKTKFWPKTTNSPGLKTKNPLF